MKKCLFIFMLLPLLVLTGCWDSRELSSLSYVMGIGLDKPAPDDSPDSSLSGNKGDGGPMFVYTVQVSNIKNHGTSSQENQDSSFFLYEKITNSIPASITDMKYESNRDLFFHHNEVILFSAELAQEGVLRFIDYFMRDYETRKEVWLFLTEGDTREVLGAELLQYKSSTIGINEMVTHDAELFEAIGTSMISFVSRYLEETTAPILPVIKVDENSGNSAVILDGFGVFKDDRLAAVFGRDDIRGYLWIMDGVHSGTITVDCDLGGASVEIIGCTHKQRVTKNGEDYAVDIKIDVKLELSEIYGFENMIIRDIAPVITELVKEKIDRLMRETLAKAQELNADIFGFGKRLEGRYPGEWENILLNWDEVFSKITISPVINVQIVNGGNMLKPLPFMQKGE